jgi:hypothetical protein
MTDPVDLRTVLAYEAGWKEACEACALRCDMTAKGMWEIFRRAKDGRRGDVYFEGAADKAEVCASMCRDLASRPEGKP